MNDNQYENNADDERAIQALITSWSDALNRKDAAGVASHYDENAVLFDAIPPYKTVGLENIRQVWATYLSYFPEKFHAEHANIEIHVAGDTAFMHALHHFVTEPADHPVGKTWMRVSVGYRRINGVWKIVHEHVSLPFNPMDEKVWVIKDPADLGQ